METYLEFRASLLKLFDTRKHKITGSVGVYDAYKWIRKNKWLDLERPVTEKEFYSIVRRINDSLANELTQGNDITLPKRMGKLELRKYKPFIGFKNNKLITKLAIDWDATLKLWYDDLEAFEEKILVKIPAKEIFRCYYNKYDANYENKSFFDISINRDIKRTLTKKIKEGQIDAFLI